MGKKPSARQASPMWVNTEDLQTSSGHPFFERLNRILAESGFDAFVEGLCAAFYADRLGRPSLRPGRYFRLLLIGYFEGLSSERGIAWRVADSWSLRSFLDLDVMESVPDHSTLSRTRRRIDVETHVAVFTWVLEQQAEAGLVKGKTVGVDATTLEANAAMRSIERRDTGESYEAFVRRLAEASGIETPTRAELARFDRSRKNKKTSNEQWQSPQDPDLANWTRGDRRARFEQTAERHAGLSQFAAPFLSRMKFVDEQGEGTSPTLAALRVYREHRAAGRRGVPPDAPLDFAPTALQPLIRHNGVTDRRRGKSALFLKVRDEIQTGNLAIDGAKNFGRFEAFFLPTAQWEQVREAFWARTGFPVDPAAAVERLKARLSDAFDQLHRWLDACSRTIRLADLLIEVENDLGFSVHFQQPGEQLVDPGEVCALLAAILAHGCNLGLYTMEKVVPDIAYRRLKYVSDWRLVEENQRAALAAIVHGISRLDAAGQRRAALRHAAQGAAADLQHPLQRLRTRVLLLRRRQLRPVLQPPDRVHRPRCALRARRRALPRERPRPRRALHRHPRLHRDQLRGLRDGRHAVLPAHPQPAPPADLLRRPGPRPRRPRAGPQARPAGR